jgi:hypothetical protein
MVTIRSFRSQVEAAFYRSVLDSRGIDSFLGNEFAASLAFGETVGVIDLQVNPEDVEAALRVLNVATEDDDPNPIYYPNK